MRFRIDARDGLKLLPAALFGWLALQFFRALLPLGAVPVSSGSPWKHALLLLGGLGLVGYGFVLLHRKRAIADVPRSRLRSVAMGFAEVSGTARMRTQVMGPYSGIPCVTCRFLAEEEDEDRRGWRTIESGQSPDWFVLEDDTGSIVVDPDGANLVLGRDYRTIELAEGWLGRRRRYTEWRLHPGETACVIGTVRRVRSLVFEQRAALHDRLRDIKQDPARLAAFDANHDGRIDTEEWGNVVRVARQEVVRDAAASEAPRQVDELILGKGKGEKTFVITDRTERDLVRSLAWKAGLALLSGAALFGAGAHALLQRHP